MNLKYLLNKTVLITGASSGIGFELAKIFASCGAKLIVVARSQEGLTKAAGALKAQYPDLNITAFAADLSLPDAADGLLARLDSAGIESDILVNDAGFGDGRDFIETPLETLTAMVNTNVVNLTVLTHRILGQMLKKGEGKILNLASTGSFIPGPHLAVYCATKAYVLKLSQALHFELRNTPVTVTALCPGATDTNFARRAGMEDTWLFTKYVMQPDQVALIGFRALMKGRRQVTAGFFNQLQTFMLRFSPVPLTLKLADLILKHRP